LLRADSHKAGTVYGGDYVNHGMCKMKLNQDIIESVGRPNNALPTLALSDIFK